MCQRLLGVWRPFSQFGRADRTDGCQVRPMAVTQPSSYRSSGLLPVARLVGA